MSEQGAYVRYSGDVEVRPSGEDETIDRINHRQTYSLDGACTNGAESYFSRLRRGEIIHHHHIAGPYLLRYAQETAWREDLRWVSNGEQVHGVVKLAMRLAPSVDFCGYWQRALSPAS